MKNQEMEARIRTAVSHAVPDELDSILSACMKEETTVTEFAQIKKKSPAARILAAAAALLLVCTGIFGYQKILGNQIDYTVALDVNPSIELKVNARERVVQAEAKNEDARIVLKGMDLEGADVNVAANAIVGSMLKNGYISELANSILVTVESGNAEKGAELEKRLSAEISNLLSTSSVDGSVLSQTLSGGAELQKTAGQYGISIGKARLIRTILDQTERYTFEDLAGLTITELNLIAASKEVRLDDISRTGTASDKGYIGTEKAKTIALEHAGVQEADARALQIELDCYNGVVVYEVEFAAGGKEYDYEINAKTGMLVDYEIEYDDDDDGRADDTSSGAAYIGAAAAKKVAFEHSGVSGIVRELEIDLETENGKIVYEVQFKQGGMEYDYKIDALTGSILFRETEKDGDWYDDSSDISGGTSQDIGAEEALKAAKKHGGISGEVYESEIDRETENGKLIYEIQFKQDGIEYEYKVDAQTGRVLSEHTETDDGWHDDRYKDTFNDDDDPEDDD